MPYWRLSGYYFFYFAALGALVPFWGLYLQSQGFGALAIGQLMAILMATKVVAPPLWGWLGDHLGHRMRIVRLASLASALVFGGMFWAEGFWPIALVMILFSFFWNASLPQFEVVTFTYLAERVARYARIRVWGSIGFILTVMLLGVLVDARGAAVVLPAVLVIYVGIWLSTLLVRDPAPQPHPEAQPSILTVLRRPAILAFFGAVFFMQMGHGAYYAFYTIYMEDHGYSKTLIGQLWALGVLAEVALFLVMHRLLARWGGRRVLVASLLVAALRWVVIGLFPSSLALMLLAQLMHAATFGTFHAAAIHLVHHYFRGRHQGRGQALYSSLSFGAGGALGSLSSGMTWDALGATQTFLIASGISVVGALLAWRYIDRAHDY
ncbi:MAG: transporter, family, 3-phenylpropionic acid transporter [Pseudomonadota bacterium]